jgi:Type II secretion system (T2SS), protein M subtype b
MAERRGKLLALTLAAAFAGLALLATALPVSHALQIRTEIQAGSERLTAIRRGDRGERGGEDATIARLLIEGGSSSRATAEMLNRLSAVSAGHGIAIRSSNVMQTKQNGELSQISIQINYQAGISAVRGLLHEIETGTPMLIIDELNMRTITSTSETGAPDERVRLDVTMTVSGLTASREGP